MPGQPHSQLTPTALGHACLGEICHLRLWQNDRGLNTLELQTRFNLVSAAVVCAILESPAVTCYSGNSGVVRIPNKSQHRKLTLEKKDLLQLLPGLELATI